MRTGDLVVCREPFTMFFETTCRQLEISPASVMPGDIGMFLGYDTHAYGELTFLFGSEILCHYVSEVKRVEAV